MSVFAVEVEKGAKYIFSNVAPAWWRDASIFLVVHVILVPAFEIHSPFVDNDTMESTGRLDGVVVVKKSVEASVLLYMDDE